MESGPGKPVQCQITPTADGKCSVSLVITHPGSSVDACLLVYLSEALPHLPIGEDSTATLWSVFPTAPSIFPFPGLVSVGTQAPLRRTPADPVAAKELMSQWLASHQANAPVRAVSDLLERRLGNLQLEYHAVMPRTVFAIWVDVAERDPFVYQPDAPTSHTMAVYP
jgi:hypothetical protein